MISYIYRVVCFLFPSFGGGGIKKTHNKLDKTHKALQIMIKRDSFYHKLLPRLLLIFDFFSINVIVMSRTTHLLGICQQFNAWKNVPKWANKYFIFKVQHILIKKIYLTALNASQLQLRPFHCINLLLF